jgi:hypothetical protein
MYLSQATEEQLNALDSKAHTEGKLLEIRNKFGLLLGVGTSLSAFHGMKDKKGNPCFNVIKNKFYDEKGELKEKVIYDVSLDIYEPRTFKSVNEKIQQSIEFSEKYWASRKEVWDNTDSILKECPGVLINRLRTKSYHK